MKLQNVLATLSSPQPRTKKNGFSLKMIAKLWLRFVNQPMCLFKYSRIEVTVYRIIMNCICTKISDFVTCLICHTSPAPHFHVFDVVFLCVESTHKSSAIFVCSLTGATAPCPCVAATRCPDRRSQRHILPDLPQVVPRRGGPHGAHEAHTQGPQRFWSGK